MQNEKFKDLYLNKERNERIEMRDEIIERCKITQDVFYDWLMGRTRIREVYDEIIYQVAEKWATAK